MQKRLLLFILFFPFIVWGQAPAGYYDRAVNKKNTALHQALYEIIKDHKVVSYDGLWNVFQTSDTMHVNGQVYVWDMYSADADKTAQYYYRPGSNQCGNYRGEGDCYNREHSVPKSWFGNSSPMASDAFHLVPTDGYVNGRRSNHPFGEVAAASWTSTNGSKVGGARSGLGYSGTVFEPIDAYKGDFARNYLYMAVRYKNQCSSWGGGMFGSEDSGFKKWAVDMLLQWHRSDPVSQKEINRNNEIYKHQRNRNPFIDYPELAEHIWGSLKEEAFNPEADYPHIIMPAHLSVTDFGNTAYLHHKDQTVKIQGAGLTGNLTLSITGQHAALFSMPVSFITQEQAEMGYDLNITFTGLELGSKSAQLTISGGGLINNVVVNLHAYVTNDFMALPASDIAWNGFDANWTLAANASGYSLDVFYMVGSGQPGQVLLEESMSDGLPSGWTTQGYVGKESDGSIRLGSSGNDGAVTLPAINSPSDKVLTVSARHYVNDPGAPLTAVVNNAADTAWVTSEEYQEHTLEFSDNPVSITLSAGKGSRVHINYVKVETKGIASVPVSVTGYPHSVGNVLTYKVTGLESDSTYYYTVTPEGTDIGVSNAVKVRTEAASGTGAYHEASRPYWVSSSNGIYLYQLPAGAVVEVYDAVGRLLHSRNTALTQLHLPLAQKGLYVIKISFGNDASTMKVVY